VRLGVGLDALMKAEAGVSFLPTQSALYSTRLPIQWLPGVKQPKCHGIHATNCIQ
jgi:hypothetical protein